MAEILLVNTISGLKPIDDNGQTVFHKWKVGDIINVKVTKPRNGRLHAKFFVLLDLVFQHQDIWSDPDDFREAITIDAGYYRWVRLADDTMQQRAQSIKWTEMDDLKFSGLYSRAVDSCLKFLPGTTSEELQREVAAF